MSEGLKKAIVCLSTAFALAAPTRSSMAQPYASVEDFLDTGLAIGAAPETSQLAGQALLASSETEARIFNDAALEVKTPRHFKIGALDGKFVTRPADELGGMSVHIVFNFPTPK